MPFLLGLFLGAVGISTAVFGLFCLGIAKLPAFAVLAVVAAAAAWRWLPKPSLERPPWWTLAVLLPFTCLYLWHAISPEVQPDSLSYHLTLARQTQTTGAFPAQISFYHLIPQGMETLFAFAYAFGGEPAAKLTHFAFLCGTVPLIVLVSQRLGLNAVTGWGAALFYFVTPVAGASGTCTYNDAALAFAALATFSLLLSGRPVAAGVAAGFCYAIKFTGGVVPAAGLLWLLIWRRREALRFSAAAVAVMAPWLIRNTLLTGNPFAPLLNGLFPNSAFHWESEQQLGQWLRNYGEVDWQTIPLELTFYGDLLQGLLAPGWLLLPIGLLSLRHNAGRRLIGAALVAGAPWFLNVGARFLLPALPFLAMALFLPLPRLSAIALVLAQAVLSWPPVIRLYAPANTWALPLRPETHSGLRDTAAFVEANTPGGARILDLANAPAAITPRVLVSGWQTAAGDRMAKALHFAAGSDSALWLSCRAFPERALRRLRITLPTEASVGISLHEVRLRNAAGQTLPATPLWLYEASPNPWEAPLAADGNPVSAWYPWKPVHAGMYWEADFAVALGVAEICVWISDAYTLAIEGVAVKPERQPALNYRKTATRYLKRERITHVLAAEGSDAYGAMAKDIATAPGDWDLERIAALGNLAIYRVP